MQISKSTTISPFAQNKVSHNSFLFLRYAHLICEMFVYKYTEKIEYVEK